jgi:dephospho-CoA kinase
MVVGLTGGIGSGKTTVVNFFKEFSNVAVYIADIEAIKLMNSSALIKSKLLHAFGSNSFINNTLNRPFIADIVFKDTEQLAILNSIVHPQVGIHFQEFVLKNAKKKYVLYEAAILFENKSNLFCDFIIAVTAPLETRIQRVILRDNSTKTAVLNRVKNQWKEEKKTLQSHYIINNISLENTKIQVNEIHNILTKK